ncbi:hypothetical protein KKA77_03115 [Patescibacteria group bacterium]|nr:hypothetical protein [Patescibacteria group bacterium]
MGQEDPRIIVANIIRMIFGFLGIIAVCLILYAGWLYMTAGGEEDKVEKAKKILIGAVIGIIICLSSFAIASFILNKLLEATGTGGGNIGSGGGAGGGIVVLPRAGEACSIDLGDEICATGKCATGFVCDKATCKCKNSGLPGIGEACLTDALDTTCSAGACDTGLTCNSSDCICKETNQPGEGQNCDADTSLADCQATECSNNLVCSANNNCTCVRTPLISWISPLDASSTPNGAPGNFITIGGQYFGTSTGQVIFLGDTSTSTDDKIATFPNSVNAQCTNFWQDNQIIIVVPNGAVNGPIKVIDSNNLWDTTDNNRGPAINNFKINNIKRPGLCLVSPNIGGFGDSVDLWGVAFTGPNNVGIAYFGNQSSAIQASLRNNWTDTKLPVSVPNIQDGKTSVFITNRGGGASNSLGFTVKNNIQNNPTIDYLSPTEGPKGQYVTIYGSNFKNFKLGTSIVKFYLPTNSTNLINADVDFPQQCQGKYWNDAYITVKVPQVATIGDYKVIVINENNSTSTPANFKITTGSPSPGLCLLDPYNGPVGQSIQAYGEYFGASQGVNSRAVFYDNASSSPSSWADKAIQTSVPSGSQTGPFKVINNNQVGNALPFKVGACSVNTDCLNSSTEECCPSGTYNAGICKTKGECSMGGPQSCNFGWTFSTAKGTSTPLTCGGFNTASACSSNSMCPNSPGKCSSRTNIETGDCNNVECNRIASSSCAGQCVYDNNLNKCKLSGFVCDVKNTILVPGFTVECRKVESKNKNIWQIDSKGASCPIGTYLETNNWCSVGTLGSPSECTSSSCPAGLACQEGKCIISSSGCSGGSFCGLSGKCIKGYGVGEEDSTCECCCRVANSAQDCCAGLTCKAGGCGVGAPDYGVCTGCRVKINQLVNKDASDQACNCTGKTTRYCDLTDLTNPTGVCKDRAVAGEACFEGGVAGACTATSTCASGFSCERSACKCELTPSNPLESCSGYGNKCSESYYCPNSPLNKCSSSNSSCDCCCTIADNDATGKNSGCCEPLTCDGRCGSSIGTTTPAIFGSCTGCAKAGTTQADHNNACNCLGTRGKFCDVSTNSNGVCKDCAQILDPAICTNIGAGSCCVDAQNRNACRSGVAPYVSGSPVYNYCSYYPCNTTNGTCGSVVASSTSPSYRTSAECIEKCKDSSFSFPQFGQTCINQATTTQTCANNLCTGFSCLNINNNPIIWSPGPIASSTCGTCCCDPSAVNDQCKAVKEKLICLKNKAPCSGEKRGLCCGCAKDDECGNSNVTGCNNDTCCSARPRVTATTTPVINGTNICRNTVIEATFNQTMNITSFNNNVFLLGDYDGDLCPAGTKFLGEQISRKNNNIFSRTIKRILISLEKILKPIFGQNVLAVDHNFCSISGTIGGYKGVASTTVVTFTLQKALDANRKYYVVIQGDASSTDSTKEGVLSTFGVSMVGGDTTKFNAKTFFNSKIWSFTTSKTICQLDHVIINPASYLFQSANSEKDYNAKTFTLDGQEITPLLGIYSWDWNWTIDDNKVVDFKNLNSNTNQQTLFAPIVQNKKDGKTKVNAKATITDDNAFKPPSVNQFKIGKANVYVLMCANPWPPIRGNNTWFPWQDTTGNCSTGLTGTSCINNNFEFYYCRDAGQIGTADDLPVILNDDTVVRGYSSDLNILKEYYFLREDVPSVTTLSVYDQESGGKVVAEWATVTNASGYKLYYGKTEGQYDNSIDVKNVISYPVTGLTNDQVYYFAVSAYYSSGAESIYSNKQSVIPTDKEVPAKPSGLVATAGDQKVTLTWTKANDDTEYYQAFYGTATRVYGEESTKVNIADSCLTTECKLTFENLVNNTTYYFAIKAFDSYNNDSGHSNEISVMPK